MAQARRIARTKTDGRRTAPVAAACCAFAALLSCGSGTTDSAPVALPKPAFAVSYKLDAQVQFSRLRGRGGDSGLLLVPDVLNVDTEVSAVSPVAGTHFTVWQHAWDSSCQRIWVADVGLLPGTEIKLGKLTWGDAAQTGQLQDRAATADVTGAMGLYLTEVLAKTSETRTGDCPPAMAPVADAITIPFEEAAIAEQLAGMLGQARCNTLALDACKAAARMTAGEDDAHFAGPFLDSFVSLYGPRALDCAPMVEGCAEYPCSLKRANAMLFAVQSAQAALPSPASAPDNFCQRFVPLMP